MGLSNSTVNVVHQDQLGFMWFGTLNGLHRYNGYELEVFKHQSHNPHSIAQNGIKALFTDNQERIWITYSAPGLSYFDPKSERFVNFYADSDNTGLFDSPVNFVFQDLNNRLWICTDKGICTYDEKNRIIKQLSLTIDNKEQTGFPADFIMESSNGLLWIVSQHRFNIGSGILIVDPVKKEGIALTTHSNSNIPTNNITYALEDSERNIWIGTHDHGVLRLNAGYNINSVANWEFKPFLNYSKTNPYFKRSHIAHIFQSSRGELWFSTNLGLAVLKNPASTNPLLNFFLHEDKSGVGDNPVNKVVEDAFGNIWAISALNAGLFKYDPTLEKHKIFKSEKYNDQSLSSDGFNDIYIDNHDILWLATGNNGIDMLDLNQKKFTTFRSNMGTKTNPSSNKIFGMDEDVNGNIWIASYKGLNKYNPQNQTFQHFHNGLFPGLLSQDEIFEVYCDSENKIWIGYLRILLSKFDPVDLTNEKFTETEDDGGNFFGWSVRSIIEDRNNNLWIASNGSGLWHYDRSTKAFSVYTNNPNKNSINSNQVFALYEDAEGMIWIGTKNDGLNRYNPDTKIFDSFVYDPSDSGSIQDNQILCITEGKDNIMWIGSAVAGLIKFDKSTQKFNNYSEQNGLCDNMVKGILIDDEQNLWLSTNNGLAKFNPKTESFITYTHDDGIQGNEFNILSYYKTSHGKMIFGGTNGLTVFDPSEIKANPYKAKPVIHELLLFNKPIHAGEKINSQTVLDKALLQTKKITLNHKNNVFSLGFTALHFSSPGKIKYHYKLEGFENDWNIVDAKRRVATFTNLDPGDYVFRLKATNNDGVLSDEEASLKIEVMPAWWETKLFNASLLILIVISVFLWIRVRTYRLKSQKTELKKQVAIRTMELSERNAILEKKQNELIRKNEEISKMSNKIHDLNQARLRFFTNISHEFKTPLTLMLTPTEKILKLPENTTIEQVKPSLNLIHKNEKRLLTLINQLLEIRKIETGALSLKVQKGNPITLLKDVANLFIQSAGENSIKYYIDCLESTENEVSSYFDADKLEKISFNLLSNAFKYSKAGDEIFFQAQIKKTVLKFKVEDTGRGIRKEDLPKIFDRFNNINSNQPTQYDSAGIGLSYVKDLIEMHKGKIYVSSQEGQGSVFSVEIPLAKDNYSQNEIINDKESDFIVDSKKLSQEDQTSFSIDQKAETNNPDKSKLLIIEDNKDLLGLLCDELKEDFNIFKAGDGHEGLELAMKSMPDIILSDVMMPGMNGISLCEKLKNTAITSHIPIILLTAKSAEESQIDGIINGADDYITKPFSMNILRVKLLNLVSIRKKLKSRFLGDVSILPESLAQNNSDEAFIQDTVRIIKEHIQDTELNADKLSKQLNVSRSFLYKKIDALSGQSVNEFIRIIRLKASVELMQNTQLTLSEIAYSVGFTSLNYFSKSFKKHFNQSPSQYLSQLSK